MKSDTYRFIKWNLCILLLFGCINHSFAQQGDTLRVDVGNSLIDGSFINDYTNKWNVYVVDAQGNEVLNRIWTDYGQLMELNGTTYLHRVQDLYAPDHSLADTWINMVEHKTLKPQKFYSIQPTGRMAYFNFYDDSVSFINNLTSPDLSFSSGVTNLVAPVFDWNLYGFLLVGLPFEEGAVYALPFWSAQTQQVQTLIAEVHGKEVITALSGRKMETTKISTNQGLVFWLSKEAPYVLWLELSLPNGSKLVWKPEE